jgi:hypothetical protein
MNNPLVNRSKRKSKHRGIETDDDDQEGSMREMTCSKEHHKHFESSFIMTQFYLFLHAMPILPHLDYNKFQFELEMLSLTLLAKYFGYGR